MRSSAAEKEVPDNTVFWSTLAIVTVFVVVLATVMVVREGMSGAIVLQYDAPMRPFAANPYACLDVPACGSEISFMCCAEQPMAGTNRKCTAPLQGWGQDIQPSQYDVYGGGNPICPKDMPNRCNCPEKFQYRQSWPVPFGGN